MVATRTATRARSVTKYVISFPSKAMALADGDLPIVAEEAHGVTQKAKAAGVDVFGGGIEESVKPVLVSPDGSVGTERPSTWGQWPVGEPQVAELGPITFDRQPLLT